MTPTGPPRRAPAPISPERFGAESYRLVVESVKDYAIFHLDPEGHIASWTPAAERIKGYAAEEIVGEHFSIFYPPEDLAAGKPERGLREAARAGSFEDEGWRLRKDGSRFWANVVITALRAPGGELVGFAKVTRDLTARRQQEEAQRKLEGERAAREATERSLERLVGLQQVTADYSSALTRAAVARAAVRHLSQVFGAFGAGLWVYAEDRQQLELLDSEGYGEALRQRFGRFDRDDALPVPSVARSGQSLFLGSRDELVLRFPATARELPGARTQALALLALTVKGDPVGALVLSFAQPRAFDADLRAFLEVYAQHTAQALDRARLFQEADEAVQVREEFLAVASHELRTPLTALDLVVSSLLRGADQLDPSLARRLEIVRRQSARLKELVGDLLDVGRISAGKLALSFERVDLAALVREVVERFRDGAEVHGTPVELQLPLELWGKWDRARLDQVVANLLENAMKYGAGRPVSVLLEQQGGEAVLSVRDQGIGIAPEDHPRIFGRFERAASSRHFAGLGLGLWITRQLVLDHGGTIEMESAAGAGAVFRVRLPVSPQA